MHHYAKFDVGWIIRLRAIQKADQRFRLENCHGAGISDQGG